MSGEQKNKLALFDVCHTLVQMTTVGDFIEKFLLSKHLNPNFKVNKYWYHIAYKVFRRLHLVSGDQYRMHYVYLFKGYTESQINVLADLYLQRLQRNLKHKTVDALRAYKKEGYEVCLVTAGFDAYLKPFAEFLGARLLTTVLEKKDGAYTGKIDGVDCIGEGKIKKINDTFSSDTIDWEHSVAFGDTIPDSYMLSLVGKAVAVDPDYQLKAKAKHLGWDILNTEHRVKIVYLITSLHTGGAEITIQKISSQLDPERFSVVVLSLRPLGEIGLVMKKQGIDVRDLGMGFKYNVFALFKLFILLRKIKPKILHTFLSHANIIGRIIGACACVPIIISSIRNERFGGRLREKILQWTDRFANITTIVSKKAADRVIALGIVPENKHVVIRNGYDLNSFPVRDSAIRSKVRSELNLADTQPMLVAVGRLAEQKGYSYLIDSVSFIKKQYPDVKLYIIGVGDLESELIQQINKADLKDSIILLGLKNNVSDYYNAADIFVLASLWEGFSNVILEAMACGLPVVVTDVGGAREAVMEGVSGYIVPPQDSTVLANKIVDVITLSRDLRIHIGDAARATVEREFSLEKMLQEYEKLYEKMLSYN